MVPPLYKAAMMTANVTTTTRVFVKCFAYIKTFLYGVVNMVILSYNEYCTMLNQYSSFIKMKWKVTLNIMMHFKHKLVGIKDKRKY